MKRVVLPLMAVAILAACGGADEDSASTAPGQPTATQPADGADTPETAPADSASAPAEAPAPTDAPADSASTAPTTSQPANGAAPPADVPEALKLSAPLVGGGDIELTTLAGRPVLLWFWAPW